ncbi:DUF998 domain-containing protein [Streptomyces sp. ISL-90]|nr:DUF998 domain-containing protein [Streptomyces sp. ISL-90]
MSATPGTARATGANRREGFDGAAAVTRSLLGWGVVVGPFYLIVSLVQVPFNPGFDLTRHPLSLLMQGDMGWVQMTNLILSGLMVIAAAVGFLRAPDRPRVTGWLVAVYGVCLVGSGIFPPDPMAGFPAGSEMATTLGVSGLLHFAFGAVGFVTLGIAAIAYGSRSARLGERGWAIGCRVAGAVIILGFFGGAALSAGPAGVASLWLTVLVGWAWLAAASVHTYRTVPHPDAARRVTAAHDGPTG